MTAASLSTLKRMVIHQTRSRQLVMLLNYSRPRQIAILDQILYVSRPIRDESTDQSRISGTRVWHPWFLEMAPVSQSHTAISV